MESPGTHTAIGSQAAQSALLDPAPASANGSDLLALARDGDRTALARLWDENRRWVAVVLLAHKPAETDLEDLMQDVAVTLVTRLGDVRDDRGFRGWLRMVAVNAARAAARSAGVRRKVRRLDLHELDERSAATRRPSPSASAGADSIRADGGRGGAERGADRGAPGDDARRLLQLSLELPEEYREPLLLKSLQSLSYRQIGVLLDLPETTVETRITRARRMLRDLGRADGLGVQRGDSP